MFASTVITPTIRSITFFVIIDLSDIEHSCGVGPVTSGAI
jgi:hypothetical protein